jgi:hypothetical protein
MVSARGAVQNAHLTAKYMSLLRPLCLFALVAWTASKELQYVYDRAVCTGLGDRVGAMMTLATLARMHNVDIVFRWCGDPSEVFSRLHKHIPKWHGYDYNLTEFQERFLPSSFWITIVTPELSKDHKESPNKILWQGLSVPAESGLDQAYTTAWKTTQIPGKPVLDGEIFKQTYRLIARSVMLHTLSKNQHVISQHHPYIAVHMRGPDDNSYNPYTGSYDALDHYCTRKVLKRVLKTVPNAKILVVTNNIPWTQGLLQSKMLNIISGTSAFDDFALLLGASAIVQHAIFGQSSYSSNAATMTGVPLITTYNRKLNPHHLNSLEHYGKIPDEFHDCTQLKTFLSKTKKRLNLV